jgi:hypothetical protein
MQTSVHKCDFPYGAGGGIALDHRGQIPLESQKTISDQASLFDPMMCLDS